jgi:hypothetical protein
VLGYVSLRQWERSAELLFREQARDTAAMAVEKVAMVLRHAEDEFLFLLESRLAGADPARADLDHVVAQSPLIQRLYLFDRRGALVFLPPLARRGRAGLWSSAH